MAINQFSHSGYIEMVESDRRQKHSSLRQSCPRPTTGTGQTSSFGPAHAGLLWGIGNKLGTIPGICAFIGRHKLAI